MSGSGGTRSSGRSNDTAIVHPLRSDAIFLASDRRGDHRQEAVQENEGGRAEPNSDDESLWPGAD